MSIPTTLFLSYNSLIIWKIKQNNSLFKNIKLKKSKSLNPFIKDESLNILFLGLIMIEEYKLLKESSENMVKLSAIGLLINKI